MTRSASSPRVPAALAGAVAAALALAPVPAALGQTMVQPGVTVHDGSAAPVVPSWIIEEMADVDPETLALYRSRQVELRRVERELRRLNATYFRTRHEETRQIGIHRLRQYTDPISFPAMLEAFARSGDDVREAVLQHLASLDVADADTTLAWAAVFGADEAWRDGATALLSERVDEAGEVSEPIRFIVTGALQKHNEQEIVSGARVADALNIYQAIPYLINAQLGGGSSEAVEGNGSLAWIVIGNQISYVSDLTPVVADSAVAFDPATLGADRGRDPPRRRAPSWSPTSRRSTRHLTRLRSSRLTGDSTGDLGYDTAGVVAHGTTMSTSQRMAGTRMGVIAPQPAREPGRPHPGPNLTAASRGVPAPVPSPTAASGRPRPGPQPLAAHFAERAPATPSHRHAIRIISRRTSAVSTPPASRSHRAASASGTPPSASGPPPAPQYRLNRAIASSRTSLAVIDASATGRWADSHSGWNSAAQSASNS
ncbi:MAG: hypothetical protein R3B68_10810 [Phycisphaerales bacterium]